jgi:hypothetical protein
MTIIETMVETRPKTVDRAVELLNERGLLPTKLLNDRVIKVTPKKVSRFASVEAEVFAVEQRIAIPEGFVGSGKAGEGGKITIVDLRGLLTAKTGKTAAEPKAAKAPKEPKAAKASKPDGDARMTKKVRDTLHEWGLDEDALEGIRPTAYKGTKFGLGDIAHLEPGLATGGKKKTSGKGKASSSASAPSESSDSSSDTTEEQDDEEDFDPFGHP